MQPQAADAAYRILLLLRSGPFSVATRALPIHKSASEMEFIGDLGQNEQGPRNSNHPEVPFRKNNASKRNNPKQQNFQQRTHPRCCVSRPPRFKTIERGPCICVDEMRSGRGRGRLALKRKNVHAGTSRLFHKLYPNVAHTSRREQKGGKARGRFECVLGFNRAAKESQ